MSVTAPPDHRVPPSTAPAAALEVDALEVDGGVIEEARRRQRHRRVIGALLAGVVAVALVAALAFRDGGGVRPGSSGEPAPGESSKLALVHGRAFRGGRPLLVGVTPSLQAGNVGVCIRIPGDEGCNGSPPTAADPVYGGEGGFSPEEKVGADGEIDGLFTGPGVAAVRVAHLGTFPARVVPGLPPGAREVLFYRAPGSRGTVLNPGASPRTLRGVEAARRGPALTETLLDASGRTIPVARGGSATFTLPNSYWQGAQSPPARGRCAMRSAFPGARTAWGQVADRIAPDPAVAVPAWLTCLHVWFNAAGTSFETAVLLDARAPGRAPAPLWGAIPVPGHPGLVQIPAVEQAFHLRYAHIGPARAARELAEETRLFGRARAEAHLLARERLAGKRQTFWSVMVPPTVARRVGPAWVLVRYGRSLAQRIRFLDSLQLAPPRLSR